MMKRILAAFAIGLLSLSAGALAQETADEVLREHLYAGRLAEGLTAMEALADEDAAAAFGVGLFSALEGLERLAQALYVHGFNPERGIARGPFFGFPLADAPRAEPEPLTYAQLRGYLETFAADMDAALPLLIAAGEAGDFSVEIDVMKIRGDIDGDGEAGEAETIGALFAQAAGMGRRFDMMELGDESGAPEAIFVFDAADAFWLAGYSQVLAAQADFLLAHDFETFFDAALHRFFPGAGLPMDARRSDGSLFMDRDTDALLADAIAAIHTINWPVTDRERLLAVRDRLLAIIELSRRNWAAILAETDDNRELIPSPRQTPPVEGMGIDKDMVEAWHETLEVTEAVIGGELLLPHWRFTELGFDLAAWFEGAERTDLVLLLAGLDALPFLKEGEIANAESFAAANAAFGGSLWLYALWFN